jgi:hypothetical protein
VEALISIAKHGDGRICRQLRNWGHHDEDRSGAHHQLPAQQEADSIRFYLRVSSLSTDIERISANTTSRGTTSST